jgi:hypothetical protein
VSDLRKWSEDGATRDELRLLDASRSERPDPAARARTLAALGLGGGGSPGGPASPSGNGAGNSAGNSAGSSGALGRVGHIASIWKLAAVSGITVGLVLGGVWVARPRHAPRPQPAEVASAAAPEPPRATPEAPAAPAAAPKATGASAREPAIRRLVRRQPSDGAPAAGASLADELAALERARTALGAGNPAAALHTLDAYRARFRGGKLASEETVLRVKALLAQGNQGEAIFVADTYAAMHPGDPYTERLRELLGSAVKSRGE